MAKKRRKIQNDEILKEGALRPIEYDHSFPEMPNVVDGEYKWKEFSIAESPGKGLGIWMTECPRGFLIPYGGNFISMSEIEKRDRQERAKTSRLYDYLFSVMVQEKDSDTWLQQGYFDANPDLLPSELYKWPGSYCNEIAIPNLQTRRITRSMSQANVAAPPSPVHTELYNSRFVIIDTKEYSIPSDLSEILPNQRFQVFLEVMVPVTSQCTRKRENPNRACKTNDALSGPVELFAWYKRPLKYCVRKYDPVDEKDETKVNGKY